ncbi:DNA mismatch repair endonuclease MutL [Massilistercora timonensis]|uniref:DNA mismatch repair endonuclease MutL n=1 Tax=Massilistercora timonensis TaxID=2086584 RepID=UPI00320919C5
MNKIQVLDQITIDKIAAGEVIERPASIVKELVENSIDAGATAVTAEIKEGGISYIRIADNGSGIEKSQVPSAFLRHSTSKIRTAEDLTHIASLGFRGEALSSIAAVSQVELITKTEAETFGTVYRIAGGKEESMEDTGARDGTTFLVRQLFYNTPARRKFLKTPMTEAGHVSDLMTRLALSHPEISFQFINNGQSRLHTSGNGNLKDVIYHVYGREIAANLLEVDHEEKGIHITGYLGAPLISRGNRNFETYFINGRYIKNQVVYKAIEDAYKDFSMQHKYPFVVLHIAIDGTAVDVNVHPAKMELRFGNQQEVYNAVFAAVDQTLHKKELIPDVKLEEPAKIPEKPVPGGVSFETSVPAPAKLAAEAKEPPRERDLDYFMEEMKKRVRSYHEQNSAAEVKEQGEIFKPKRQMDRIREAAAYAAKSGSDDPKKQPASDPVKEPRQMELFEGNLLKGENRPDYQLVGQVFDTYWIVQQEDRMYIIDQHAAHERVLYEKILQSMKTREFTSQMISPPIILNLTMQESDLLKKYMDRFTRIGFEFEEFGQESYAVRAVPGNLFHIAKKELLLEMLDSLSDEITRNHSSDLIDEKIASMSCKAAVKGNMRLTAQEADALIGELLTLENPYHCPHGRPTIIAMSKRELEKKFKRIV